MPVDNRILMLPIKDIKIPEERQRKEMKDVEQLAESIKQVGILQPLLVSLKDQNTYTLIAGERRLTAAKTLNYTEVPCQVFESIDIGHEQLIELTENVQRHNLDPISEANAVHKLHNLYKEQHLDWTVDKTAETLSLPKRRVETCIQVATFKEASGGARLDNVRTLNEAAARASRARQRMSDDIFNDLMEQEKVELKTDAKEMITCESFLDFCKTKQANLFNLIHCDFPYGLNLGEWENSKVFFQARKLYEDTPELFRSLLDALLLNLDNFCSAKAHIILWLSPKFYISTVNYIAKLNEEYQLDIEVSEFPLIWHKSDLQGSVPKPKKEGRRTYEMALFITRGERTIITAKSMSVALPTAKGSALHSSIKPATVLRHYFEMLVDQNSRVLDPTCGSGTALSVAYELGAEVVRGMDIEEEFVLDAQRRLDEAIRLKAASESL